MSHVFYHWAGGVQPSKIKSAIFKRQRTWSNSDISSRASKDDSLQINFLMFKSYFYSTRSIFYKTFYDCNLPWYCFITLAPGASGRIRTYDLRLMSHVFYHWAGGVQPCVIKSAIFKRQRTWSNSDISWRISKDDSLDINFLTRKSYFYSTRSIFYKTFLRL